MECETGRTKQIFKRSIIGSIYPEKLCFDGSAYRTARLNEASPLGENLRPLANGYEPGELPTAPNAKKPQMKI
ncbi:hypothetical protein FFF34_014010 [Inquilinus sp. KBS0705]|nr:hypothetical protein FFF34_014010 [Inquilinus sp. KBS0705]